MTASPFLLHSGGETFRLKLGRVYSVLTITGNTTDASSSASSANPMVKIFIEEGSDDGDPTVVDAGHTFTTLDDDADPAVIGLLCMCGDAVQFFESITRKISGDLTAATPTKAGVTTSGVTLLKNLAVTVSLAGVDIDNDTHVQVLAQEFFYRRA